MPLRRFIIKKTPLPAGGRKEASMIYTVTLNPSLDYIVTLDDFAIGKTNRTVTEQLLPGGKGLNVSTVLHNLGIENTALGFAAGFVGREILRRLSDTGIKSELIELPDGISRINVKLKDFDGTELNGMGPSIAPESLRQLLSRISSLTADDLLVLAGSIPAGMPESLYRDIMEQLAPKEVPVVVDASKQLLLQTLPFHPFLIKPNHHELGELFDTVLTEPSQIPGYARRLQKMGARSVLVSMGGQDAVLAAEDGSVHTAAAPSGILRNAVGAGDSMVAGFLAGWNRTHDYRYAFQMSVAAGSASAFSDVLATGEEIESLFPRISVSSCAPSQAAQIPSFSR